MSPAHVLPRADTGGATIICLHCSGGSGRQWASLIQPLTQRFEFATPDLLGYDGGEAWPAGRLLTLDDEADRLSMLLPDGAPAHLLGHSYGGAIALQMALRWPHRIASLTLYEPVRVGLLLQPAGPATAEAGPAAAARSELTALAERLGSAVMHGRLEEAAAMFVDYWGGPGTWAGLGLQRRGRLLAAMPKIRAEFHALFSDRIATAAYERLTMPVRLLGGTSSPLPARAVMRRLAGLLPQVSTVSLIGLGHMGPVDAPHRVRAHLPAWMRGEQAAITAPVTLPPPALQAA